METMPPHGASSYPPTYTNLPHPQQVTVVIKITARLLRSRIRPEQSRAERKPSAYSQQTSLDVSLRPIAVPAYVEVDFYSTYGSGLAV